MTTTGEAREVYSEALREYRAARERVSALADQARALAEALDEPLRAAPRHPEASARIPLHIMTSPVRREVDLEGWPDGLALVDALSALHAAHSRALALHSWLLPADRAAVEAP